PAARAGRAMSIELTHPWALLLLPLALLPLRRRGIAEPLAHPAFALVPRDRLSDAAGWALRVAAALALAGTVAAVAGPFARERTIERVGQGAQIAVVLDRSASMDQPFFARGAQWKIQPTEAV